MKLAGRILYKIFAEGTKSECYRPYIFIENGSQILVYRKNDNPFENKGFKDFENKDVMIEGEFIAGLFMVESIQELDTFEKEEKELE